MFLLLVHDSPIFPLSFFSLPSHWELQVCLLAYSPKQSEAIQHSHSTNASHSYIIVIGHLRSLTVTFSKMCKGTKWQQACVCSFWAAASTLFKPLWSACQSPDCQSPSSRGNSNWSMESNYFWIFFYSSIHPLCLSHFMLYFMASFNSLGTTWTN